MELNENPLYRNSYMTDDSFDLDTVCGCQKIDDLGFKSMVS